MSILRFSEKVQALLQYDEQAFLVLQINALAYQINQAAIADVKIAQSATMVNVIVKRHFQETPQIAATFSLADAETKTQSTRSSMAALFIMRLRAIVHDLQTILDEGTSPTGEAA